MVEVSAVFVNYRAAAECARAVASFRRCLTREGVPGEAVVVDCASEPAEAEGVRSIGAERLALLPENRGYAGGINAGVALASGAVLLLCNADIEFLPGAITPLLRALGRPSAGVAAPVQFGDSGKRVRLPSGFPSSFVRDLLQVRGCSLGFSHFARLQSRLWTKGGEAPHLTGSILAVRRSVWDAVGPFDERFSFEYEETEWEARVRRAGLRLLVVPESNALHFRGTSSGRDSSAQQRARGSRQAYRQRRYGRTGARLLDALERRPVPGRPAGLPADGAAFPELAVSPNASMLPFVGIHPPISAAELASIRRLIPGRLYFRHYDPGSGAAGPIRELISESA